MKIYGFSKISTLKTKITTLYQSNQLLATNLAHWWTVHSLHLFDCDCLCKNKPSLQIHIFGQLIAILNSYPHHVSCGQTRVVCFFGGWIYYLENHERHVGTCAAHQLGAIGLRCCPWPEWCPFGLVAWSGPTCDLVSSPEEIFLPPSSPLLAPHLLHPPTSS